MSLTPQEPHYSGKVVILIDEVTQSQAEYTTMAFRTAPGAIVIGSTTAGADGNVSTVPLAGGFSSYISGIGVFYPDKRPTQRVGIIPDIEVRPTIEGFRAGRDELIQEAIRQIKPPTTPSINFSLKDQAGVSSASSGTSSTLSIGYGTIQPDSGSTPAGLAILGLRQNNILVSEAVVPGNAAHSERQDLCRSQCDCEHRVGDCKSKQPKRHDLVLLHRFQRQFRVSRQFKNAAPYLRCCEQP